MPLPYGTPTTAEKSAKLRKSKEERQDLPPEITRTDNLEVSHRWLPNLDGSHFRKKKSESPVDCGIKMKDTTKTKKKSKKATHTTEETKEECDTRVHKTVKKEKPKYSESSHELVIQDTNDGVTRKKKKRKLSKDAFEIEEGEVPEKKKKKISSKVEHMDKPMLNKTDNKSEKKHKQIKNLETNKIKAKTKDKKEKCVGKKDVTIKTTVEGSEGSKKQKKKKKESKLKKENDDEKSPDSNIAGVAKSTAVEYLKQWSCDRKNWKFQKVRQVWLLKHLYDKNKISDDIFPTLLEYLEGLSGKSRETTLAEAEKLMEGEDSDDSSSEDDDKSQEKEDRLRQVIQMLS